MKYNNLRLTKLIILLLATALCCSLSSCGDKASDPSGNQFASGSETSSDAGKFVLSLEEAAALVEKDKKVIELFVCNSLCGDKTSAAFVPLSEESEYYEFSAVEALLSSVYLPSGDESEFFLSYPLESAPSLSETEGKTRVFFHPESGFDDFIDPETVSVEVGKAENEKLVKAKTLSGREVSLTAVYEGGAWYLKNSLFNSNPAESEKCEKLFPASNSGSLAKLSGRVLVIELFVYDNNASFTDEEEAAFHTRISSAVDYLASEAERYGGEVEIVYESVYFHHAGTVGNGDLPFDITIGDTGFGTLQKLAESHFDLSGYDSYFFAVCFNRECEPLFKVYDNTDSSEAYFGERLFVGTNTSETVICRNVLSMLGAYDYRSGLCDEYREQLYQAYFPNDVMASEISEGAQMSPVTAYCCGVTDDLDPLYRIFLYEKENSSAESEE